MQSVSSLSWLEWPDICLVRITHYLLPHNHLLRLDKSEFRGMLRRVLGKDPMTLPKRNQQ